MRRGKMPIAPFRVPGIEQNAIIFCILQEILPNLGESVVDKKEGANRAPSLNHVDVFPQVVTSSIVFNMIPL